MWQVMLCGSVMGFVWQLCINQYSKPPRLHQQICEKNFEIFFISYFIVIINNRGLNARWCLTPLLLSLPTAAYLGQRGLTPAGLSHTTAQCHLTILGEAVLFCLNHPSFRTPGSLSFCCRSFCRYGRRAATFSVSLSAVGFLSIESFCTILH